MATSSSVLTSTLAQAFAIGPSRLRDGNCGQNGARPLLPQLPPSAPRRAPQGLPPPSSRGGPCCLAGDAAQGLTYRDAGVDIDAGAELVRRIAKLAPGIGGFGGLYPFGEPMGHG